jgi:hypothetical protein
MAHSSEVITVLVPLPLTYNPDARGRRCRIGEEKFQHTMTDIAKRFGGGVLWRFKNDPPNGYWWSRGYLSKDVLGLVEVDIPDTVEARAWLESYAETVLLKRFRQDAIYLKFVGPVKTTEVTAMRTRR